MTTIYDHRSQALSDHIRQEMLKTNNVISFAAFMELALYHPEWGYYNADTFDLGQHGDFTTAPEISSLFAKCIARQIQQITQTLNTRTLLELGAGTGRFAGDVLTELNTLGCLPDQYYIYEISKGLRKNQQHCLQTTYPHLFSRIIWLDTLPENFTGTIVANEVLDALPVNCFRVEDNRVWERCVTWKDNQFSWQLCEPSSPQAVDIQTLYSLPNGYEFEINLNLQPFLQSLSRSLTKGTILFSDYGYGQREYYHPERSQGTLCCFYQHKQHNNPLVLPGLQDITAHVDFTRLIDNAVDCGFSLAGYSSQTAFLLATGLIQLVALAEKNLSPADEFKLHHAVKLLTLPTEMGERIKFMALSKGVEIELIGFGMQDRRREL